MTCEPGCVDFFEVMHDRRRLDQVRRHRLGEDSTGTTGARGKGERLA
jgi:hypothetical protein